MIITNLSSILLSLTTTLQPTILMAKSSITTQVQLLSLTNTLSRLVVGPLADFLAPVPVSYHRAESSTEPLQESSPSGGSRYELGGVVDDVEAPAAVLTKPKTGVYYAFPRMHYVSRVAFFFGASLLLMMTFLLFLALNSDGRVNENSMSLLSVGVGITYGTTFTVLYVLSTLPSVMVAKVSIDRAS